MESIWGIAFRHGLALRQSGKRGIGADVWFPGSPLLSLVRRGDCAVRRAPGFRVEWRTKRRWTMKATKATWKNGRILPAEPVDWPEGSELVVEPMTATAG